MPLSSSRSFSSFVIRRWTLPFRLTFPISTAALGSALPASCLEAELESAVKKAENLGKEDRTSLAMAGMLAVVMPEPSSAVDQRTTSTTCPVRCVMISGFSQMYRKCECVEKDGVGRHIRSGTLTCWIFRDIEVMEVWESNYARYECAMDRKTTSQLQTLCVS